MPDGFSENHKEICEAVLSLLQEPGALETKKKKTYRRSNLFRFFVFLSSRAYVRM
jgi:hypothetical protein